MIVQKIADRMDQTAFGSVDAEIDEELEERCRVIQARHPHVPSASNLPSTSKIELASLVVFTSQHRGNALAFSRLREQLAQGTRLDPHELATHCAIIYPPLSEGFVLLELNLLVVLPALEEQHIPVDPSWIRRYWVVTTVADDIPYVLPLPRVSTLPAHPLILSKNQPLLVLSRRAFNTDVGDALVEGAASDGVTTVFIAPQKDRVQRAEARFANSSHVNSPDSAYGHHPIDTSAYVHHPLDTSAYVHHPHDTSAYVHHPADRFGATGPFTPPYTQRHPPGSIAQHTPASLFSHQSSFGEDIAKNSALQGELKNVRANDAKIPAYSNLVGGRAGFLATHGLEWGSQLFTPTSIVAMLGILALNEDKSFLTFRVSAAFQFRLLQFVQALAGNPDSVLTDHTQRLWLSDMWSISAQDASSARKTLDCASLRSALEAFADVLDLMLAKHPEAHLHVKYKQMFTPILAFMGDQMNGMDPACLAHFAETFFFKVVHSGFHSIAPHPSLGDTKSRVLAVINATMSAVTRPSFAKDYQLDMEFTQRNEARVKQRDVGAYYLPTGNGDDHGGAKRRGEKRDLSNPPPPKPDSKHPSPDKKAKPTATGGGGTRPPTKMPCRANLAQQFQLPGACPCSRASSCPYQHCSSGKAFISTFGREKMRKFINDLPDRVPQQSGGVDLHKAAFLAAFNAIK